MMYTLVTFATQWGTKHGGINSFNADLLAAFSAAYHLSAQVVCIVASGSEEAREDAANSHVRLLPLPYSPKGGAFEPEHGEAGVEQLKLSDITLDPDKTMWLGHDRITGAAAIAAARIAGGRSAVVHHMSYDCYESYAENSQSALIKTKTQAALFQEADIVLAVGPLLRDAARDLISDSKTAHMLIPGLAEIDSQDTPKKFVAFLSGRLSDDAARIKQGNLGIAAFAKAHRDARENEMPDALRNQPKLLLRGIDFEGRMAASSLRDPQAVEFELQQFAFEYADAVINLHALPYTEDRQQLYSELSKASVALMPSWHEGFGLVAWEAIAAGVPLILGKQSGVYRLLEEDYPGAGTGCVYPLDVKGSMTAPFFHPDDLTETVRGLKAIANNQSKARKQASILREMLLEKNTWAACAEQTGNAFGWDIKKGSVSAIEFENLSVTSGSTVSAPAPAPADVTQGPLHMPVGQWRAGAGMADSQLLRAEEALLPFDSARQPDVDRLNEWLDDPQWLLSVRLITGAGGQGKTRLALEVCQQRLASGWLVGLLDSNLEANRMAASWQTLRKLDQPLLIVIDYAETRQSAFLALLKAALQTPAAHSVRILLLARDGGEWWDNLPSKDPQCEALLNGYATTGPFRLPALYTAEQYRREAYAKALHAFAQTLGVTAPEIVPDLHGEHFERPLYIQMAALLALYGERPTTAQGLTKALLNHERRYWRGVLAHFNWPEPERRAEQLLALTTLAGGFVTPRTAEVYWEKAKAGVISRADFNSLFRALATLYPGTQGLQALRPDLLGEALVAQALLRPDADMLLDVVLSNAATQFIRRNALTVLARLSAHRLDLQETLVEGLSRHFVHCCIDVIAVSKETASRLPALAELAFTQLSSGHKSQVAGMLTPLLEEESVQLAELNCLIYEYLTDKFRKKFESKPGNSDGMDQYATTLGRYGIRLARAGRPLQACDIGFQGLELHRRLAIKDPKRFEPNYAASLINYANHLGDVGRSEEACEYNREALDINRRLAQKNPDRFDPAYAASLTSYASHLGDVGRSEEACEYDREALDINRRLAQKNPDRFDPAYTASLTNYANHLSDVGRSEEALNHAYKALDIDRRLAQRDPDRFESDYATSMSNYADHLSDVGRSGEAYEYDREALEITKRLAQKNPDRFDPAYARSLSNYAYHLSNTGQYQRGIEYFCRGMLIYKQLAEKNVERFAGGIFSHLCSARFLAWLSDQDYGGYSPDLDQLMVYIPTHRRSLMLLYSAFVAACSAADQASRQDAFRCVLSHWTNLLEADKVRAEADWLCAAAWWATFEPAAVEDIGWEARWRQFVKQRNGSIPQWMLDVARRLEFQWPM